MNGRMNGYVHLIVIKLHERNPILIVLDHLIHVLTFKVNRSAKNTIHFLKT